MAKSKKKTNAPNIAFIERIEIQIKDKKRQSMLKRAPKPAGANTGDILNQQYLLQRTLAQRIQPQQQSQSVNIYLGDIAKLQQQETFKRIDEDAGAAILRQKRGGINQERLDAVLTSLLEQRREVKQNQPPPQSFDYGFVEPPAAQVSERQASVAALERLNKSQGPTLPRVAFFEQRRELSDTPPVATSRRALSTGRSRVLEVEEQASALSKMTAQELYEKYPDITAEIIREGKAATEAKYRKRRAELKADVEAGKINEKEAKELLSDFSIGIGLDRKPRFKQTEPAAAATAVSLTPQQEASFPKTAAVLKKSSVSTAELSAAISANTAPSVLVESIPSAEGGQSQQLRDVQQSQKVKASGGRSKQAQILQPTQQTISAMFKQASAAADNLVEAGSSSPIATPPPSRPGTAESARPAAVKRQPTASGPGQLPNLSGE